MDASTVRKEVQNGLETEPVKEIMEAMRKVGCAHALLTCQSTTWA